MDTDSIFSQFEALYTSKRLPDWNKPCIKDGIIDPVQYAKQNNKILFIAKEHNQLNDNYTGGDYRVWCNQHVHLSFAHRLSEWAYGILNDFSTDINQLTYDEKHKALKSVAFINVKKVSGKAKANWKHIHQYISESQSLLHQQILEIKPTLIICGFRYDSYANKLFGKPFQPAASNSYSIGRWKDIPVINFWHPSSRKSKQFLYEQLKEAVAATRSAGEKPAVSTP